MAGRKSNEEWISCCLRMLTQSEVCSEQTRHVERSQIAIYACRPPRSVFLLFRARLTSSNNATTKSNAPHSAGKRKSISISRNSATGESPRRKVVFIIFIFRPRFLRPSHWPLIRGLPHLPRRTLPSWTYWPKHATESSGPPERWPISKAYWLASSVFLMAVSPFWRWEPDRPTAVFRITDPLAPVRPAPARSPWP